MVRPWNYLKKKREHTILYLFEPTSLSNNFYERKLTNVVLHWILRARSDGLFNFARGFLLRHLGKYFARETNRQILSRLHVVHLNKLVHILLLSTRQGSFTEYPQTLTLIGKMQNISQLICLISSYVSANVKLLILRFFLLNMRDLLPFITWPRNTTWATREDF